MEEDTNDRAKRKRVRGARDKMLENQSNDR